ncbi:protein kinase family protein [Streptomyces sp. 8K308]|uniref:protein kinase family protein n=1 Tax=Streptomyces sp. 8K308 TaxID=2530388 RepID=UPI001A9E629F|nr:protein kinase family protein [Streptomyces sp. 8K308]
MAERSTATSPPQQPASTKHATDAESAEQADTTTIALTAGSGAAAAKADQASEERAERPRTVELHSGHRLAKRYRLEECITRLDGFSSWRAVDEKLRRAVGVHVLPANHERAPQVLAAARAAALLGDPKFVQVLDAVEENGLVHVIHEWLPDATPLSTVLATGSLDAHEAYALASQVAQAMAAAHRKELAHLRLTPATVLRTGPGQFRIRGLAVDAALRGITSETPKRTDTEAIGALLYAALTQRWPYAEGAYGLSGVAGLSKGSRDSLVTPDQLRAGVHRGLSEIAMRALVNEGATATSQKPPFTSPEEIGQALGELPRIRPPEDTPSGIAGFQRTTYQRGTLANNRPLPPTAAHPPAPPAPALPGRTGTALKWGVSALLIAALGLGSWQLADALLKGDNPPAENTAPTGPAVQEEETEAPAPEPVTISEAVEFNPGPGGNSQNPELVSNVIDGDPDTSWHTKNYEGPSFGNLKDGLGLVLDLGEPQTVSSLTINAVGDTPVQFRVADPDVTTMPSELDDFSTIAEGTGDDLTLTAEDPIETQFVLVWLTDLPVGDDGKYRGRIAEVSVSG